MNQSFGTGGWTEGESCLPVFVNKVLLEHDPACSFTYYLWLFLSYKGKAEIL